MLPENVDMSTILDVLQQGLQGIHARMDAIEQSQARVEAKLEELVEAGSSSNQVHSGHPWPPPSDPVAGGLLPGQPVTSRESEPLTTTSQGPVTPNLLLDLPDLVLLHVLEQLQHSRRARAALRGTCSRLRALINSSVQSVQVSLSALVPSLSCFPPTITKLEITGTVPWWQAREVYDGTLKDILAPITDQVLDLRLSILDTEPGPPFQTSSRSWPLSLDFFMDGLLSLLLLFPNLEKLAIDEQGVTWAYEGSTPHGLTYHHRLFDYFPPSLNPLSPNWNAAVLPNVPPTNDSDAQADPVGRGDERAENASPSEGGIAPSSGAGGSSVLEDLLRRLNPRGDSEEEDASKKAAEAAQEEEMQGRKLARSLKELWIDASWQVTCHVLRACCGLPDFKELHGRLNLDRKVFPAILQLTQLTRLEGLILPDCGIYGEQLRQEETAALQDNLESLTRLAQLATLGARNVTHRRRDVLLRVVAQLPALRSLHLAAQTSELGWDIDPHSPHTLELSAQHFPPQIQEPLAQLETLHLTSMSVDLAGVMKSLPSLRNLRLDSCVGIRPGMMVNADDAFMDELTQVLDFWDGWMRLQFGRLITLEVVDTPGSPVEAIRTSERRRAARSSILMPRLIPYVIKLAPAHLSTASLCNLSLDLNLADHWSIARVLTLLPTLPHLTFLTLLLVTNLDKRLVQEREIGPSLEKLLRSWNAAGKSAANLHLHIHEELYILHYSHPDNHLGQRDTLITTLSSYVLPHACIAEEDVSANLRFMYSPFPSSAPSSTLSAAASQDSKQPLYRSVAINTSCILEAVGPCAEYATWHVTYFTPAGDRHVPQVLPDVFCPRVNPQVGALPTPEDAPRTDSANADGGEPAGSRSSTSRSWEQECENGLGGLHWCRYLDVTLYNLSNIEIMNVITVLVEVPGLHCLKVEVERPSSRMMAAALKVLQEAKGMDELVVVAGDKWADAEVEQAVRELEVLGCKCIVK